MRVPRLAALPGLAGRAPSATELRPPLGLTVRGVLLLIVLFALAVTAVYPLREYVQQRTRIEQLAAKQRALQAENDRLRREQQRLHDPAYVEQLAERDYNMVKRGVEVWQLTGEPPQAQPAQPAAAPRPKPWYQRLWRHATGWLP
ncbi:MAG TPA: septum formation initiator family protein [Actinomycetota bacterium]